MLNLPVFHFSYDAISLVVKMSITGSIVMLGVLIVRLFLRKAPKIFSYMLWGIVLFRLLCPVSFSTPVSILNIAKASNVNEEQMQHARGNILKTQRSQVKEQTLPAGDRVNAALPQIGEQVRDSFKTQILLLTVLWGMGIAAMLIISIVSYIRIKAKVSCSMRLRDNIFLADEIDTPFCLGVVNPHIYLPSTLEEKEREYIIIHEQHHIKRCDHIVKLIAFLTLCLHWFNPLVWLAFVLAGKDMEMSCDEAVMKRMDGDIRAEYAASLLNLATGRRILSASPLGFGEGNPKQRIKNIMNYRKPGFWVVVVAVILCVVTAACLLSNPGKTSNEANPYGEIVASLKDYDAYAFLPLNYKYNVMVKSNMIYDEGTESQASTSCDIYYCVGNEIQKLGTISSEGTAYPISFSPDGIFVASAHSLEKYVISEKRGELYIKKGVYEIFDAAGEATYKSVVDGAQKESTEKEFRDFEEEYTNSQIIHFSYGADGCMNEWLGDRIADNAQPDSSEGIGETQIHAKDQSTDREKYVVENQEYVYFGENGGDIGQLGEEGIYFSDDYPKGEEVLIFETEADLTHDGNPDLVIIVGYALEEDATPAMVTSGTSYGCYVKIYRGKADGSFESYPRFISRSFEMSHAVNGTVCLTQLDGKDYLLFCNIYEIQGNAYYNYGAVYVSDELGVVIEDSSEADFAVWEQEHNDWNLLTHREDVIDEFKKKLMPYLNNSIILLSMNIDEGEPLYSTKEKQVDANMFFNQIWKRTY